MKKNNFQKMYRAYLFAAGAAFIVIGVIFLHGCKKDTTNQNVQDVIVDENNSWSVSEHILSFKARMAYYKENPEIKSGGQLYTADSALLELKSLLNFNYCYVNIISDKKKLLTDSIIMPLDEMSRINDPNLTQFYYNKVIELIRGQMSSLSYANMKLLMVDLQKVGTTQNGDAIVQVNSIIGNQVATPLHDDSWWFGEEYGTCNGNSTGFDAAIVLDQRVTADLIPVPPTNCRWYFIPTNNTDYLNPTSYRMPNDPLDNYEDYQIFFAVDDPDDPNLNITYTEQCVSGGEMVFYETQYKILANNYANSLNKKFYQCDLYGQQNVRDNKPTIEHFYKIYVGNRYLCCDEESPVEDIY